MGRAVKVRELERDSCTYLKKSYFFPAFACGWIRC